MAYTYSRAKSTTLKAITTTTNLKKEVDEAKEAKKKSLKLGEALTKDLNALKVEREGLQALLSNLTKEKRDLEENLNFGQEEREALQKEMENLEMTALNVFYEF
uniref:Uncharacterized protein n=1 Tax=Cannabis sativa TaxID=3483 RepID=A0A803NKZ1_CANSA